MHLQKFYWLCSEVFIYFLCPLKIFSFEQYFKHFSMVSNGFLYQSFLHYFQHTINFFRSLSSTIGCEGQQINIYGKRLNLRNERILFLRLCVFFCFRADYWVSQARKYCEFCKCWIADNKPVSVSGTRTLTSLSTKFSLSFIIII